jgi:hypothetical protein
METSYSWADSPGGGTETTLRNRGQPTGFSRLAAPVIAAAMRRANRKDLKKLKSILECLCNTEPADPPAEPTPP